MLAKLFIPQTYCSPHSGVCPHFQALLCCVKWFQWRLKQAMKAIRKHNVAQVWLKPWRWENKSNETEWMVQGCCVPWWSEHRSLVACCGHHHTHRLSSISINQRLSSWTHIARTAGTSWLHTSVWVRSHRSVYQQSPWTAHDSVLNTHLLQRACKWSAVVLCKKL